jgi:UPF0176 protein
VLIFTKLFKIKSYELCFVAFYFMHELRNQISQKELKKRLIDDSTSRTTISFYKYHFIENPGEFRDELFKQFSNLEVLGRIYVAHEGINAQLSVPTEKLQDFNIYIDSIEFLKGIRLNIAVDDDGKSFWVLKIKVREKIVADGIDDETFDMQNRGKYVSAEEFNKLTENPETVVVDMRNYYEFEVGHFENAIEIPSDTFREQLPMAAEMLEEKQDTPIVMYCTGGIRCEKASAYLKHKGFSNVFHLEGGIINYVRNVNEKGLENKFKGKNFVFDNRFGERISDDVVSNCHQCGESSDRHTNCENFGCHLLFIQCENCFTTFDGCCSVKCKEIKNLPEDEQIERRRGNPSEGLPFNNSSSKIRKRFFDEKGIKKVK